MTSLDKVLEHIDANLNASVERLLDLLKIRSISTDPAFSNDCRAAANWLAQSLRDIGFDAGVRDTKGHPMVVAHARGGNGTSPGSKGSSPHVLFYGHYDVQPVDPVELWSHAPFDAKVQETADGKKIIFGRGASDDKGQLMTFVEACRAYREISGELPISVSILFEGEEESSSPSLIPFLEENRAELSADLALVCDTAMWNRNTPAITTMLRGLLAEEITITGPSRDLHSGGYGNAAINPIHVLTKTLADLRDQDGRVVLEGFYEGVIDLPEDTRRQWEKLGATNESLLGDVGLGVAAGEKGFSALEQIWVRPSCEINGIQGGYTGDGFKTVIPAIASAKVSFRLVGHQDPEKIRKCFRAFVRARLPADCSVKFASHGASPAIFLSLDSEELRKSQKALADEWDAPAVLIGCGGSIPVVGEFKSILDMDSLLIGFALDDDNIHSPNEKYDLDSYHKGIRAWARILEALA